MGGNYLRNLRNQSVLFFVLDFLLVVRLAPVARRLLDDVADGLLEYPDPDNGSRPTARPRHVRLFDDVHGHGPLRSFLWRSVGGAHRSTDHDCRWRSGLHPRSHLLRTSPARTP